jgi:hypothetical protein
MQRWSPGVFATTLLLCSGAALFAHADAPEEEEALVFDLEAEEEVESPQFKPRHRFRGALSDEVAVDLGFEGDGEHVVRSVHRLLLTMDGEIRPDLKAHVSGRMTWFAWFEEDGAARYELDPELRDTWLQWSLGDSTSLIVGNQTWSWGVSDVFPVADGINPRDLIHGYTTSLETPKIPVFGVTLRSALGDHLRFEAVWVPFFVPDRAAVFAHDFAILGEVLGSSSAFISTMQAQLDALHPSIIDDVQPLLVATERPDEGLENSSAGLRLAANVRGVDLGASYFFGWDRIPVFAVPSDDELGEALPGLLSGETAVTDLFASSHARRHWVGVDLAVALGDFIVRGESAWTPKKTIYRDDLSSVRLPIVESTGGLEYSWETTITAMVEVFHRHIFDLPEGADLFLAGQDQLQIAAVLATRWLEFDALQITLAGMYGITQGDFILSPSVTWKVSDTFQVEAGGRLFEGPVNSLGGAFDSNDEVFLQTRVRF